MNNQEKLTTRSSKSIVQRANSQTILLYPVRFFIDIFFSSVVYFTFFVFLFFKNIYSDTHSTMRAVERWKKFHPTDFRKQDYFFMALFSTGLFGAADGWGWRIKRHSFLKICHTYSLKSTMIRLGTVIPYLKKTTELTHVTHPLNFADMSIFLSGIGNFCFIKKYRYRLHFNT